MEKQTGPGSSVLRSNPYKDITYLKYPVRLPKEIWMPLVLFLLLTPPLLSLAASPDSDNAADDYRRGFVEIARLLETGVTFPGPNEPFPTSAQCEPIVARLGPALKCLHEAKVKRQCDWGIELHRKGAAAEPPNAPKCQALARGAIFRARYYWQSAKRDRAIEDLRAVLVLARRVSNEGRIGLVGLTERYKMEQAVVDVLRKWIVDAASAQALDELLQLALTPEGNLPKVGLLLERETLLPWTRRLVTAADLTAEEQKWRDQFFGRLLAQHGSVWILKRVEETRVHYTEVGELLELPVDQFLPKFRQYLRKLDGAGNPFSQVAIVGCPGIPGAYLQSRKLHAQWTILQAASMVFQQGPAAMAQTRDPYHRGPLVFESFAEGFTIRSALVIDGKPTAIRFTRIGRNRSPSDSPS